MAPASSSKQNRPKHSTAQHSKPTQQESKGALQKKKKKEFSAALCTHLGVNIGVKGPTAFELFMVYRTLGERGEKVDVWVQASDEQMNGGHT